MPTGALPAPRDFMPCPVTSATPLAHAESEADEAGATHAESAVAPDPALEADAAAEPDIPSNISNGIENVAIQAESEVARGLSPPITGLRGSRGEEAESDSDTILPSASFLICGTATGRSKSEHRSRQNSTTCRRGVGLGHPSRGRHQRCDWHREFCRLSGRCGRLRIHSSSDIASGIVRGGVFGSVAILARNAHPHRSDTKDRHKSRSRSSTRSKHGSAACSGFEPRHAYKRLQYRRTGLLEWRPPAA